MEMGTQNWPPEESGLTGRRSTVEGSGNQFLREDGNQGRRSGLWRERYEVEMRVGDSGGGSEEL